MAKQSFEGVTGARVQAAIAKATGKKHQQEAASPEEQNERAEQLRTQGRKGCKRPRYNIAFTPTNHAFIELLARSRGMSLAQCCNAIIDKLREQNPEIEKQAKELQKLVDKVKF